jgi:hypothetical protein
MAAKLSLRKVLLIRRRVGRLHGIVWIVYRGVAKLPRDGPGQSIAKPDDWRDHQLGRRAPLSTRLVNQRRIPDHVVHLEPDQFDARQLVALRRAAEEGGELAIVVPVLNGARVVNDRGQGRAGRSPVGGKHRLPHDECADIPGRPRLQNFGDCGGPPQTRRSSGRKEHNQPGLLRS